MTKLEEVAKAIDPECFDPEVERVYGDMWAFDRQCKARDSALAAIKALENPDDEFLARFHDRCYSVDLNMTDTYPVQREFIRAFIDTILSEKEQGK